MSYNTMTKVPVGWTLSPENVASVKKAADKESRSMSQWADVHFTKFFAENPA